MRVNLKKLPSLKFVGINEKKQREQRRKDIERKSLQAQQKREAGLLTAGKVILVKK